MTDRELMQQALAALDDRVSLMKWQVARDALRERLADTTHTCSYHCERPECVRAQRDELRERLGPEEQYCAHGINQKKCGWCGPAREEPMPMARTLTDELMDCVDRLGSEADLVDPRVWDHLLVYAPKPARQEQEPVLWMVEHDKTDLYWRDPPANAVPLYTAPQREWVGLTEEELEQVFPAIATYHESNKTLYRSIARAIEAKLKERNT